MVPPTLFISGGMAVLHLCNEVYTRLRSVKRYRKDCEKLARFVHRIEAFITETEDDADMTAPAWQAAFEALNDSLQEVVAVFEGCAKYGMIRSLINADELNLHLNSISQRLMLALQLIPIQKAKATDKRLGELQSIQLEIRNATFAAVHAAEEQSAALKRLMDQSRVDASKTQEMLAQVLMQLQNDPTRCAAAAAAGGLNPSGDGDRAPVEPAGLTIDPEQLHAELADLHAELEVAVRNKNVTEEEYLDQIIMAISAVEEQLQGSGQQEAVPQPPVDLLCPITLKLLEDPVILVDSAQTYERGAIQEWLDRGNRKDPVSGVQLVSTTVVPNIAVRKMAQDWGQANPAYRRQQEEAASRAAAASQRQQHSPAAEDVGGGKGELQAAAAEDECVSINPKTAAILSAGQQAGFDPSALCPVNGQQAGPDPQDKEQAQQAYARAVAAAAAADSAAVVAMPAVTFSMPAGGMAGTSAAAFQADRQYSSDSSAGGDSRCSSITFARGASAQTLPRLFTPPAAVPEATDICLWPSQGPERQQQQSPGRQRQPSPRQQRQPSPQQQRQQLPRQQPQQQQRSPRGFSLPGNKSRQERAAAAAAAAAAVIAGQQKGGFQLRDLHGTLDRAAESRFAMSMRLRGPQAAEQVREASQQLRQEREVQRQAGQQQEERAYLQQHMERLMRDQAQQQQQPYPVNSNISSSSVPLSGGWQQPAGMNHASSFPDLRSPAGSSQAAAQQHPGWGEAAASSSSTGPSSPPNSGSYLPPRPVSVQGDPRHAAMPPPQPDSLSSLPSSGSLLSRFRRSGQADAPPSSQCDDTASISSAGSSASRRSLRGLLGAVKSVKYAMVYDDTKV